MPTFNISSQNPNLLLLREPRAKLAYPVHHSPILSDGTSYRPVFNHICTFTPSRKRLATTRTLKAIWCSTSPPSKSLQQPSASPSSSSSLRSLVCRPGCSYLLCVPLADTDWLCLRAVAFWTKSLALLADAFHYVSWTPISARACVLHRQQANLTDLYLISDERSDRLHRCVDCHHRKQTSLSRRAPAHLTTPIDLRAS